MRIALEVPTDVYQAAQNQGWQDVAKLGYGQAVARALSWAAKSGEVICDKDDPDGPAKLVFEEDHDSGVNTITSISPQIKTVPQLLKHIEADLEKNEVVWSEVSKWDTPIGKRNTGTGRMEQVVNFLVKVRLRAKSPETLGQEVFLEEIKKTSKPCKVKSPKRSKKHQRALEVDILDPHLGLLCRYPEADAPWDLDIAEEMIFDAIDTIHSRASVYGPFEEIIFPIGNDFFHSDDVFHRTTAGTEQPESISWHHVYVRGKIIAIKWVEAMLSLAPKVKIIQIPGNHSRVSDFTLAHILDARFHADDRVEVDCSSSPYKFWRYGVNLVGFEHGHSVQPIRLAALMANEVPGDWNETKYREWHLGDQHRKGSSKPNTLEEQGVSVEYLTGLTAPNEWHRLKSFSHQKRGATGFVWDKTAGPIARIGYHIGQYDHKALK